MAITSTTSSSLASAVNLNALAKQSKDGGSSTLLTASTSVAAALSALATNSAPAAFNLAFNQLQNTLINRLNDKIKAVTDSGTVDHAREALLTERQRLVNLAEAVAPIQDATIHNYAANEQIGSLLGSLNEAVAAADGGDSTQFDSILAQINTQSDGFQAADGSAIGLYVGDGTDRLKRDGVVRVTRADGSQTKATKFSDFASAADALNAITQGLYRDNNVAQSMQVRSENLATIINDTQNSIDSIDTQLAAGDAAKQADQLAQVAKLKQQYGLMLQNLSYAFTGSQSIVSQLDAAINGSASTPDAGSVLNLFT
jgi:hypothetical protein